MMEPESAHGEKRDDAFDLERYIGLVFRQVPGAIWATDDELRITYAQGRVPALRGVDAQHALHRTVGELVGAADATDASVAHHLAALTGTPQQYHYELGGRWFNVLVDPLRDEHGGIIGCVGTAIDATERRRVEEDLAVSRRRLEEAQQVAHVGSFEWEIAANHVTWSDELERIYGVAHGAFGGTFAAFSRFVYGGDEGLVQRVISEALRSREPFAFVHRIRRTDGAMRVLHTRGDVITDAKGVPLRVVGSCWDVTEMTAALEQVKRAHSLLEATLNATADGILVIGQDGKVSAYNQRFLALWRIPAEMARDGTDERLLAFVEDELEDPAAFMGRVRELYCQPEREVLDVLRFRDGRVFERFSLPQRMGAEITGRVWSFRDVTERERLLQRALFLADAGRLLASLDAEAALDAVAHLAVPYLGDACAVDLTREDGPRRLVVVPADGKTVVPPPPPPVLAGHVALDDGNRRTLAVPLTVHGVVAGALTFVARPRRPYDAADVAVAEDLAQRASLTLTNAKLYRDAQEALRARDEFLAIAAHEIRGPIASMHLAIQRLERAGTEDPVAAAKLLSVVKHDEQRLTRFVEDLLDIGRARSGQLVFNREDVDLAAVTRDVVARMSADVTASGCTLSLVTEAPVVGRWDRFRLEQVATNLLSNALKFGQGRPVHITVSAREGTARLEVRDEGIGIEPAKRERIFRPFERLVSARHYGGLGLGLHIARVIVEAFGGTISVESEVGAGSTFTVELPLGRGPS